MIGFSAERIRELLTAASGAGSPIDLDVFAKAALSPHSPVWSERPPKRRGRNWRAGGAARSAAAALLGKLRAQGFVERRAGGFYVTSASRDYLGRGDLGPIDVEPVQLADNPVQQPATWTDGAGVTWCRSPDGQYFYWSDQGWAPAPWVAAGIR